MRSIEILERLIAFPTISAASNLALIDFVEDLLIGAGLKCRRFPSPDGTKAALFAERGPGEVQGILLSAHSDVVPVSGQAWTTDPFQLAERSGKLYGRGTADMKGFLACVLAVALRSSGRSLGAPLQIAISYDEEVGCIGVRPMLDELAASGMKPRFCLIGEPTRMHLATGHKGKVSLRAVCRGTAAHSSAAPMALNAIHLAADLLAGIRQIQAKIQANGARDPAYDVPYSTLHAGVLNGGTALNIVPEQASLEFEIRHLANDDPDVIIETIREIAAGIVMPNVVRFPEAAIDIDIRNRYPGLETSEQCGEVTYLNDVLGEVGTIKVAFGTEAGLFHEKLGATSIVCGPGSIEQGHKADEYIERSEIERCDSLLDKLVLDIAL